MKMNLKRFKENFKSNFKGISIVVPLICLVFIFLAALYQESYSNDSENGLSNEVDTVVESQIQSSLSSNDTTPSITEMSDGSVLMAFTSDRSDGDSDIWITRSNDCSAWSWPTVVTQGEDRDTNPFLFHSSQGLYFLAFESTRPSENTSFNNYNPGGRDSYIWISASNDGETWEEPLQLTRKGFGESSTVVNDTDPFLFQDVQGSLVLLFHRNVIASGTERSHLGISRFETGNKVFSQDMFLENGSKLVEYQGNSASGSALMVNEMLDPVGFVFENGTEVVVANDMLLLSNVTKEWSPVEALNLTTRKFLLDLVEPDVVAVGSHHLIFSQGVVLKVADLNQSGWEVVPTPNLFRTPSVLFHKRRLLVAFENQNGEDTDILCFTSADDIYPEVFHEELFQGGTSLVLGNDRSYGNQTVLFSAEGIVLEDMTVHYVMAFESTSSGNTDIWITISQDGVHWEGLLDVTPSLENERDPVLYSTNEKVFVIYKVGSKIGSKSSSDLVNWGINPEIPSIESETQKYFQRDKNHHLFINETGVWYSKNFIHWKMVMNLELHNPSMVLIDQDNFVISSQNDTSPDSTGIDVYHLKFKSNMESDNILPTLIIILLVVVIILILMAMVLEIQR